MYSLYNTENFKNIIYYPYHAWQSAKIWLVTNKIIQYIIIIKIKTSHYDYNLVIRNYILYNYCYTYTIKLLEHIILKKKKKKIDDTKDLIKNKLLQNYQ